MKMNTFILLKLPSVPQNAFNGFHFLFCSIIILVLRCICFHIFIITAIVTALGMKGWQNF